MCADLDKAKELFEQASRLVEEGKDPKEVYDHAFKHSLKALTNSLEKLGTSMDKTLITLSSTEEQRVHR